jgi:hypothetical protein
MSREIRLATALAHDGYHQRAWLDGRLTIGQLARTLADHDGRIEGTALELALPISGPHPLEALDLRSGDRLLLFARTPRLSELPLPPQMGEQACDVRVGLERGRYLLRASAHLSAALVAERLAQHFAAMAEADRRLYALRHIAPHWTLAQTAEQGGAFIYAALDERRSRRLLRLTDADDGRVYELRAEDEAELTVGAAQPQRQPAPHLDIRAAFGKHTPTLLQLLTPYLLRVQYRAFGDQWMIRLDERAPLLAYINERPLSQELPMRLLEGDELALGISHERLYARLRVSFAP